ncbi:MAG TPA: HAD family hydrolase [Phycisphaerales bacterium]|nr:HAD family hydrolase [Phycisphaerales bacterium]
MLVLFDIDGTILLTQGAGIKAMHDAGRELYGEHFSTDGIDFSGRLDPWIWGELARINNVKDAEAQHETFRAGYRKHLTRRLAERNTAKLLPGVRELVEHLNGCGEAAIGLLTGNYPETGRLKIQHAGLDPDVFTVGAWGIDGKKRSDLPPVAMQRHHERTGHLLEGERVVIIGDTPHDVDCAKAHGCRVIGVATGWTKVDELKKCGADVAVPTLEGLEEIVAWILKREGVARS